MDVLLVLAVLVLAAVLILGPLRSGFGAGDEAESPQRVELEAAKEAKYREIREAELDYRTGKLSPDDWQRLDSGLRREAIELLRRLDALDSQEKREKEDRQEGQDR
jgi:hypothetical protein